MTKKLSRRAFLRQAATAGATTLLAACQPKVIKETVEVPVEVEKRVEVQVTVTAVPGPSGDIMVWGSPHATGGNDADVIYKPLNAQFNDKYPDVKVQVDVIPWSGRREKLYTAYAGGAPPDVFMGEADTLETYGFKGVCLPLQEMTGLDDYTDEVLGMGTYEGDLLIVPFLRKCSGPLQNTALLEELGYAADYAPRTWDEILDVAAKAKSKDLYFDEFKTRDWQQWLFWLRSADGTVYSDDRRTCTLREQGAVDALTMWKLLYDEGFVPPESAGGDMPNYFMEHKEVSRWRSGLGSCVGILQQDPEFPLGEGGPRQMTKDNQLVSGYDDIRGWSVTNKTKYVKACTAWIGFYVQPEVLGIFCTRSGAVPPTDNSKAFTVVTPCQQAHIDAHLPYQRRNQDSYTLWQESKVVCAPHFDAVLLDQETVEEALDAMATELQVILDERYA
jgi:multiple sugar transport system substrate-binding protein